MHKAVFTAVAAILACGSSALAWDAHGHRTIAWLAMDAMAAKVPDEAKKGELAFFYHTGKEKAVVGVVKVIKEAYPDTTADEPFWSMVDVEAVAPFPTPVTLAQVKADAKLKDMALAKYARLSVQPVTDAEWKLVCKMGGYKG